MTIETKADRRTLGFARASIVVLVLALVATSARPEPIAALYLGYAGTGDADYYADD